MSRVRRRFPVFPIAILILIGCHGCASGREIDAREHGALMPVLRARWDMRAGEAPADGRYSFRPGLEAEYTDVRGHDHSDVLPLNLDAAGDFSFHVTQTSLLFEPEMNWRHLRWTPIVGPTYCDLGAEDANGTVHSASAGVTFGLGVAWTGWSWLEPYARFSQSLGVEFVSNRYEVGVGARVAPAATLLLAWSRQASRFEELDGDWLFFGVDRATVRADGIQIGLSIRF